MVKVSIIIPVYNAQKHLKRCIDSILKQEFEDFEAIFIDDGSTDKSPKILDEYALKDTRIKVIHKENSGVSDTRNVGLKHAKGKYIQFVDADDWLAEHSTKELVRAIEQTKSDLVVADFYRVVGEHISRKGSILSNEVLSLQDYAEWMMESPADFYYGVLWNKLYRKSIIDEHHIKMDKDLSFCEDFVFNLEYLLHCKTITPLQIPVYYYVKTDGSLVAQNLNIPNIIKMKTNIYAYYNNFFKNILDEKAYASERMNIARFFISGASDDFALPIDPTTKKLGQENIQVYYEDNGTPTVIELSYYLRKAYEKYVQPVALKYSLDMKDIFLFYAIYKAGKITSQKELEDFTNLSLPTIIVSLQKLTSKGYIKFHLDKYPIEITTSNKAKQLQKDTLLAIQDTHRLCFRGFTQEEEEISMNYMARVYKNLKDNLK